MLTYKPHACSIRTSEGQVVDSMTITIEGVTVSVLPVAVAAVRMSYTIRHVRLLCDTGQLIACKITGQWFIAERSVSFYPKRDTTYYPFAG